jgi:hypothetical protein
MIVGSWASSVVSYVMAKTKTRSKNSSTLETRMSVGATLVLTSSPFDKAALRFNKDRVTRIVMEGAGLLWIKWRWILNPAR